MKFDKQPVTNLQSLPQFRDLPQNEWPLNGPYVDVGSAIAEKAGLVAGLHDAIYKKKTATAEVVRTSFPGNEAMFLTRPLFWTAASSELQQLAANWCSQVILQVYGDGYPLPNKYPSFNLKGVQEGSLLLYLGLIGQNDFSSAEFYQAPTNYDLSHHLAVATAAIVLGQNGKAELGRTGRRTDYDIFDGGAVSLERTYDWGRNRHRLLEMIHLLTSDIRAAAAHDHSPSSGAVQNLILAQMGMKIYLAAPLYNVNGLEPFLGVALPRDQKELENINSNTYIFSPPGQHQELLAALWQHQFGGRISLETAEAAAYEFALPTDNGPDIYGSADVIDNERIANLKPEERNRILPLDQALSLLESRSPVVLAKVEAQTPASAATQRRLIEAGYTVCGLNPAMDADYLTVKNGHQPEVNHYQSPAYIYLAKLGQSVLSGQLPLAPAYFPGPEDAHGVEIHGRELRALLYQTDAIIRRNLS